VDAIMIGRGAMGNPWIFDAVNAVLETRLSDDAADGTSPAGQGAPPRRELDELRQVLDGHVASAMELQRQIQAHSHRPERTLSPEAAVAVTFRCHLFRYLCGLKGAAFLRGQMSRLHTLADIRQAVDGCLEQEGHHRAGAAAHHGHPLPAGADAAVAVRHSGTPRRPPDLLH
jgi:tRNA-dihydrouridine synthase